MQLWIALLAFSVFTVAINETWATDPCSRVNCTGPGEVCELYHGNAVCVCGSCDNTEESLLCGDDGKFYNSLCAMRRYACMTGRVIQVARCNQTLLTDSHPCTDGRSATPPWIENRIQTYNFRIGENRTIICDAQGVPKPVVQWTRDNVPISAALGQEVRAVENELIFTSVTSASEGTYTCVAVNCATIRTSELGVESEPATFKIRVNFTHSGTCHGIPGMLEPVIKPLGVRKFTVGQEVIVRCEAKGRPHPKVMWKRQTGRKLKDVTEVAHVESIGDALIIRRGLKRHEGTYVCIATNCASRQKSMQRVRLKLNEDIEHFSDNCLQNTWGNEIECNRDAPKRDYWAYDAIQKTCLVKRGRICGGLYNAHRNWEECSARCMAYCDLPVAVGSCSYEHSRVYYDSENRLCKPFRYTGCQGNGNRFKNMQTCKKTCQRRQQMIDDKLSATDNYTKPDPRPADCPAKCGTTMLSAYCQDHFIVEIQVLSDEVDLWFTAKVIDILQRRNSTVLESLLVRGGTIRLKMGHMRSCKCPDVAKAFSYGHGNYTSVLVSGQVVDESLTVVDGSIFKQYSDSGAANAKGFYPGVCNLLQKWPILNATDVLNANVEIKPNKYFGQQVMRQHG